MHAESRSRRRTASPNGDLDRLAFGRRPKFPHRRRGSMADYRRAAARQKGRDLAVVPASNRPHQVDAPEQRGDSVPPHTRPNRTVREAGGDELAPRDHSLLFRGQSTELQVGVGRGSRTTHREGDPSLTWLTRTPHWRPACPGPAVFLSLNDRKSAIGRGRVPPALGCGPWATRTPLPRSEPITPDVLLSLRRGIRGRRDRRAIVHRIRQFRPHPGAMGWRTGTVARPAWSPNLPSPPAPTSPALPAVRTPRAADIAPVAADIAPVAAGRATCRGGRGSIFLRRPAPPRPRTP